MLKKIFTENYEKLFNDKNPGFSCTIIKGESFSNNEEEYSRILKDTYIYRPELYENEYGYMDY